MKRLLAIHTKSNGWIDSNHNYDIGKSLVFTLNLDNTISVHKQEITPAGIYCSLSYNYPMDDVIDYIFMS